MLDKDPSISATMMCDKHIIKMILETSQLLSTAIWYCGFKEMSPDKFKEYTSLCKPCFINHPCNKWVRENRSNFLWLHKHGVALCSEKRFRYFNNPPHKRESDYNAIQLYANLIPDGDMTEFAQAMPPEYRQADVVKAYRGYYIGEKGNILKYTRREAPHWLALDSGKEEDKRLETG